MVSALPKTEQIYKNNLSVDKMTSLEALKLMISDQKKVFNIISKSVEHINQIVLAASNHLMKSSSGRIIYCGAGTSGRIGVQDGSELYPTFGWPKKRFNFAIAGGKAALIESIEGAEDNKTKAKDHAKKIGINNKDFVIGIAASGNTPFTCSFLDFCQSRNALTLSISNNPNGELLKYGTFKIILDTGAEVVAGSTRLKAGTAQKICLNLLSTSIMIKMGKVKNGMMSNLVATNEKLKKRKAYIDFMLNS